MIVGDKAKIPIKNEGTPLDTMQRIRERVSEAVISQSGINHVGLVAELRKQLGQSSVGSGALVREPVIEGAAPFVSSGRTFAQCAGAPLHPRVIRAVSGDSAGDYQFPADAQPYRHQLEAWEHLTAEDRRSVLVSSGTGSGKTECFLMPLLHDLATEADTAGRLSGVRALALYPLNALIESQKERLNAWTRPFGDQIRFGLYNGMTPERVRAQERINPEQVLDRETLRNDPPPVLVTNVTMLEYMLVRRNDRPLIENSRGKLRWIILDEAHSYVGSAAAEIALLLRRVLLTFGSKPDDVRFVATSATIGDGADVTEDLRKFLRDLSGTDEKRIHVVIGKREKVALPPVTPGPLSTESLRDHRRLAANAAVQRFIRRAEAGALSLPDAEDLLAPSGLPSDAVITAVADGHSKSELSNRQDPLLPLRVHGFMRAVPGLWSCVDPTCAGRPADWAFGAVLPERVESCPDCEALVLEIKACRECGEPYLECEEQDGIIQPCYTPPTLDEFAALREREIIDDDDPGDADAQSGETHAAKGYRAWKWAIASRPLPHGKPRQINPKSGHILDTGEGISIHLHDFDNNGSDEEAGQCGACAATSGKAGSILRPLRFGAPFLIGNAAPVLLEGVAPRSVEEIARHRPPAGGRQLLSFTDSRQGTARFAANLQSNAERSFVRGAIYHAIQGTLAFKPDPAKIEELQAEIAALEGLGLPALQGVIAKHKAELADLLAPAKGGLTWGDMRSRLAQMPEVNYWMAKVWGEREIRYRTDATAFAQFLMLREFNRRPRRGNTTETMGLARLRFPAIEAVKVLPDVLRGKQIMDREATIEDWRGLLYVIVDQFVRGRFAIRADWNDLHWIHAKVPQSVLLPPGKMREALIETRWPMLGKSKGLPGNIIICVEHALRQDRHHPQGRATIDAVMEAAWFALVPLFDDRTHQSYALDFEKSEIAPVQQAWRCPVTRKVLTSLAFGRTPYGQRDGLTTARSSPELINFPALPITFPKEGEHRILVDWLGDDAEVATLRESGVWTNLHDRVALLSPYIRSAEHSAQQPPSRLRAFEKAFKDGEINVLNCSTTMEMGVDIGSVSAVMMTNVPPAIANYRQRVGRAGRRRQGFASSLTFSRDTPLDREAFRDPVAYLNRETFVPRVKLDSQRIVQRHVNALLLARWFSDADGEVMKSTVGDFFGCPDAVGADQIENSPARACIDWLESPTTQVLLEKEVATLVKGTVLARAPRVISASAEALQEVAIQVLREWRSLQDQAAALAGEAKASIGYQITRLSKENLLKDLAVRGLLPAHGMPTGVATFVHKDQLAKSEDESSETSSRYRSYPSRTLDIAIRDYAPGAQVVVDGLVHTCAGLTLNWQRPANDEEAKEIQSLKTFWTCPACGAGDCGRTPPHNCPVCRSEITVDAQRRFLEPSGFTVDMAQLPHADTDEVSFVETAPEQIVAKGASWQSFADPNLGRMRASADGMVFYSSSGRGGRNYDICLECGRAESSADPNTGEPSLRNHSPLRLRKRDSGEICPGNDKPFKIMRGLALGHEAITDVAEIQPAGLPSEGMALAAVAALRGALGRHLGVEIGELGIGVQLARTPLGQRTHSLLLFDRASGGAGFATQAVALFESLLPEMEKILDCPAPGCQTGCSACVLTVDVQRRHDKIDRKSALTWVKQLRSALKTLPEEDRVGPDAMYCRSIADEVLASVEAGGSPVTIWLGEDADPAVLECGVLARLARKLEDKGAPLSLVVGASWLAALDPAAKLALRDVARDWKCTLRKGEAPRYTNGAAALAEVGGMNTRRWASRDLVAALPGETWGMAQSHPVVSHPSRPAPLSASVDPASLLPQSGTVYIAIGRDLDGPVGDFGAAFANIIAPAIRDAGGRSQLKGLVYNDRYLQTPLVVRLLSEAFSAVSEVFSPGFRELPIRVVTNRLKPNTRQPFAPDHDWQYEEDRREVLEEVLGRHGLMLDLVETSADHGRFLALYFADGKIVRVIFDQGFGPWQAPRSSRFDFGENAMAQSEKLAQLTGWVEARGMTYLVVTA